MRWKTEKWLAIGATTEDRRDMINFRFRPEQTNKNVKWAITIGWVCWEDAEQAKSITVRWRVPQVRKKCWVSLLRGMKASQNYDSSPNRTPKNPENSLKMESRRKLGNLCLGPRTFPRINFVGARNGNCCCAPCQVGKAFPHLSSRAPPGTYALLIVLSERRERDEKRKVGNEMSKGSIQYLYQNGRQITVWQL